MELDEEEDEDREEEEEEEEADVERLSFPRLWERWSCLRLRSSMQRLSNNSYADGGRELVLCLPETMAQGRNTDRTAPLDGEAFDVFDFLT